MSARFDSQPIVVIGCGRRRLGGDAIGLLVAEELMRRGMPHARVRTTESPAADIPEWIENAQRLIIVDAGCMRDIPPGDCVRLTYPLDHASIAANPQNATHGLGVLEGLEIARRLGRLPPTVFIYAISMPTSPSPDAMASSDSDTIPTFVTDCVRSVASQIAADCSQLTASPISPQRTRPEPMKRVADPPRRTRQ